MSWLTSTPNERSAVLAACSSTPGLENKQEVSLGPDLEPLESVAKLELTLFCRSETVPHCVKAQTTACASPGSSPTPCLSPGHQCQLQPLPSSAGRELISGCSTAEDLLVLDPALYVTSSFWLWPSIIHEPGQDVGLWLPLACCLPGEWDKPCPTTLWGLQQSSSCYAWCWSSHSPVALEDTTSPYCFLSYPNPSAGEGIPFTWEWYRSRCRDSSLSSLNFILIVSSGIVHPWLSTLIIYRLLSSDIHRGGVDAIQIIFIIPNEMRLSTQYEELHGVPRCAHVLLWAMCVLGYPGKSPSVPCKSVPQHAYWIFLQIKGKKKWFQNI